MYVESSCLKGGGVLLQGCTEQLSLKQLRQEFWRSARGWDQLGAGQNPPNVHFFLRVKEYLFCIEWWGDPGGEFELQAIWSRVAFLQTLGVRISESPPHPHMSSRLLP